MVQHLRIGCRVFLYGLLYSGESQSHCFLYQTSKQLTNIKKLPSRQCISVICSSLWLISIEEFIFRKPTRIGVPTSRALSYHNNMARADCYNHVLFPVLLFMYFLVSAIMWTGTTTPPTIEFAIANLFIPLVGTVAIRYVRKPSNIAETLELGTPVAALISICVICTMTASSAFSNCIDFWFFDFDYTNETISIPMNYTFNSSDITSMIPPGIRFSTLLDTFVSPIPCICFLAVVTRACTMKRTFDVAVAFMVTSITVEGLLASDSTSRAGWERDFDGYPGLGEVGPDHVSSIAFLVEAMLAWIILICLGIYRIRQECVETEIWGENGTSSDIREMREVSHFGPHPPPSAVTI